MVGNLTAWLTMCYATNQVTLHRSINLCMFKCTTWSDLIQQLDGRKCYLCLPLMAFLRAVMFNIPLLLPV